MQETNNPQGIKLQEFFTGENDESAKKAMDERFRSVKIGRNARCPCGSGKKFKKCCIDKVRT